MKVLYFVTNNYSCDWARQTDKTLPNLIWTETACLINGPNGSKDCWQLKAKPITGMSVRFVIKLKEGFFSL